MIEEDLSRIIELNEKIVSQNEEIIHLLMKLNGLSSEDEAIKEEYDNTENSLLDNNLISGEVIFTANSNDNKVDIYKLTVKNSDELKVFPSDIEEKIRRNFDDLNYEITLHNLTGSGITYQFKIPLLIAFESLNKNIPIESGVSILDDEQFVNISDILRVSIENGAETIYLSIKNTMTVFQAPPMIMDYLIFYKNSEHLIECLFDDDE